jgi:hypothetical protein
LKLTRFSPRVCSLVAGVLVLGIASAGATVAGPTPAVAAPARADWESTGLTQSVSRLFNPRSGALLAAGIDAANLYAATSNGVFRLPLR